MKKQNRKFILLSLLPPILCFLIWVVYPTVRCILQSLFSMNQMTTPISEWQWSGLKNYTTLFDSMVFRSSFATIGKIWLYGGIITLVGCFRLNEWLLIIGNSFCAVGMLILIFAQLQVI